MIHAGHHDRTAGRHEPPRLVCRTLIDSDLAGGDQRLRAGPARREAIFDQKQIEPLGDFAGPFRQADSVGQDFRSTIKCAT